MKPYSLFQVIETSDVEKLLPESGSAQVHSFAVDHWISFHVLGTSGELEVSQEMQTRLLCHYVLSQIPDEVIEEALESLADLYSDSRRRHNQIPLLLPVKTMSASWGKQVVRPVHKVTEEE